MYTEQITLAAPIFIPKVYSLKIFRMRGSKYELKFDFDGTLTNEDEIRKVVQRMRTLKSKSEYIQDAKERNYKI